jgi:hypothetical protein
MAELSSVMMAAGGEDQLLTVAVGAGGQSLIGQCLPHRGRAAAADLGGVGGGEPQAGDGQTPQAVGGHGRGRQRFVAGQHGLQLLSLGDPQVGDATPARWVGGELDSEGKQVAAQVTGDTGGPVALGAPPAGAVR